VLALAFPEARRFPQAAREFLEALAQQASMALERAQLYAQTQEAVRLRDVFLSIASHELNTPLTALKLQLASAKRAASEAGPSERVQERLGAAERQVDRLGHLVRELLDVSRLAEGRLRLEPAPMDLRELAQEVLQRFEPEAASTGARLRLEGGGAVRGQWDRSRLDQVLTNLVSNALKYGGGRPVALRVAPRADGGARVSVRDEGIGIPLAQQGRLFQRFERASGSERVSGLGLGLWIARQMVEAHGGRIHLQSQAGVGTTVYVELPPESPPVDPAR
jgi:signal transduction histidine kinase